MPAAAGHAGHTLQRHTPGHAGLCGRRAGRAAIKVVTVFNDNPQRGEPTIQGVVLVHDPQTETIALMDAEHLTAMRTGVASGVATQHLARPDAATATIFGVGAQAITQLEALCAVRPIPPGVRF